MKAYVAVTDGAWYRYLADRPQMAEANFWLPGGGPARYGLKPAEPMLFKSHHPHNRLVGGGVLSDYVRLPLSEAWRAFGEANGCGSEGELRARISSYRSIGAGEDPIIGCVMLRDTRFFPEEATLPAPDDFAKNVVTVKGYELTAHTKQEVAVALAALFSIPRPGSSAVDMIWTHDGPVFGQARSVVPRLGQAAFAAVVSSAYDMRCAVTGNRVRPVLQAAHIRPVSQDGQHRIDNGLLLRADVHLMFDAGYLGLHPERRELLVSPALRSRFGNGKEFYRLEGTQIALPERRVDRPNREFLEWHLEEIFQN